MPNYEIVTMKNKVTVKCANQKMEQDLVITYKDALSSENALKKLLDLTKTAEKLFYGVKGITNLNDYIEYNDTENVTNMVYMFGYCSELEIHPTINTINAENINYMFTQCTKLKTAILDTTNVIKMESCFSNCQLLEKVDLTSLDKITSTSNIGNAFTWCYSLKKLIIRTMNTIPALSTSTFSRCYHLLGTVNSTYNPNGDKDGYIYVPDNMVNSLKSATNWSTYATQIKPLSELVED